MTKKNNIKKFLAYGVVVFFIFFIFKLTEQNLILFSRFRETLTTIIYYPVTFIKNSFFAQSEIKALKEENALLKSQIASLYGAFEENEFFKKSLNLKKFQNKLIKARIFFYPLDNKREAYISVGKNANLSVGMPVVVYNSIMVGKIIEVFDTRSKIAFITDDSFYSSAIIQGYNKLNAVAKGERGNLFLTVSKTEESIKISGGEFVYTGNFDPLVPPYLLIGKIISKIEDQKINIFKMQIEPAVSIEEISDIFVITP